MPAIDIGQVLLSQKRTGFKIAAQDDQTPPNTVASFNGLQFINVNPAGAVSFQNLAQTADSPAGSTFTVDIIPHTVGPVTFTAQGQQGNFQPLFTTDFTLNVMPNPNTPGLPTHWVVVDEGQTVAQ